MKILVVGGNSSLARALIPLLEEFAEVTTAGRENSDVTLDLAGNIDIPFGFDAVVNTASHFGGKDAASMIQAEQVNVLGTLKLCDACVRTGVGHLVHVSSVFAELPVTSAFFSIYALSKKQADEAAQLFAANYKLRLAIVRPSQFFGVGEAYRRNQPFLYTLIDKAQAGDDIVIYGSNDAQRNFIHVDDVARILALVVQERLEGQFTCAYPENVRYSQIAQAAIDAFGSKSSIRFAPDKPDIPDNAIAADDTLYRRLGYFPRISMAAGLRMEAAHRKATQ
ncbi:MAG: NAD-dependent epimerase/dehydratase family protein [Burkholderiaceae bacterium]